MDRRILVVDDDKKTSDLIRLYLERDGYRVLVASDGLTALELSRGRNPDLILLDLMLPAVGGLDVCRVLRSESRVPIIMLTARSTEEDKLLGLDLGADDYITKPFSPREVVARVRTVLRRVEENVPAPLKPLRIGELTVDFSRKSAHLGTRQVHLTPKEFRLLETLAREPGRAFSRLELLAQVFGHDYGGLERTVDVHIMNLRKKIEPDPIQPTYVQTVFGIGYRLAEETDDA